MARRRSDAREKFQMELRADQSGRLSDAVRSERVDWGQGKIARLLMQRKDLEKPCAAVIAKAGRVGTRRSRSVW